MTITSSSAQFPAQHWPRKQRRSEKRKAGRGSDRPWLARSAWESGQSLGCVGRASTNGLGTVGGQCGCSLHNMGDVLRDVQCRISALTIVAVLWEVSASGIQKQISIGCRSQEGAARLNLSTCQGGPVVRYQNDSQLPANHLTQTREHGQILLMRWRCAERQSNQTGQPNGASGAAIIRRARRSFNRLALNIQDGGHGGLWHAHGIGHRADCSIVNSRHSLRGR